MLFLRNKAANPHYYEHQKRVLSKNGEHAFEVTLATRQRARYHNFSNLKYVGILSSILQVKAATAKIHFT